MESTIETKGIDGGCRDDEIDLAPLAYRPTTVKKTRSERLTWGRGSVRCSVERGHYGGWRGCASLYLEDTTCDCESSTVTKKEAERRANILAEALMTISYDIKH